MADSKDPQKRTEIAESRPLRTGIGAILEPAILTWQLFWDSRVDPIRKLIPLGAVAYLLSPVDLLPELALGPIGMIDDIGLLLLALNAFIAICPPDVVADVRQRIASGGRSAQDDVVDGTAAVTDDPPMD
jgi:uncharacterized membrane protein YkvA (DUF1232 family)